MLSSPRWVAPGRTAPRWALPSIPPCRPIPANAARGARQLGHRHERGHTDRLNDQLSDPVATGNAYRLAAVGVDQANLDLTAIAGVHSAWRIHDADAVPGGEPGPWVHEAREACRQRDGDAGPHQPAFSRLKLEALRAAEISSRVVGLCVRGRFQAGIELEEQHLNGGHGSVSLHSVSVDEAASCSAAASRCGCRVETNQYGTGSSGSSRVISTVVLM